MRTAFPKEQFQHQIIERGIKDSNVLDAVRRIPREIFVQDKFKLSAYEDAPLPIGEGQTISQPYIVAFMSEAAQIKPTDKVLEVGTGCGYQTAILSHLCNHVWTIEIREKISQLARKNLKNLNIKNVSFKVGDGSLGWTEEAPYDVIVVTANAPEVPENLLNQLKLHGRMIIPTGSEKHQNLLRVTRTEDQFKIEKLLPVRFVPLVRSV